MILGTGKAVEIEDEAADFALPSLGGGDISLSDYRGTRLVILMWASW